MSQKLKPPTATKGANENTEELIGISLHKIISITVIYTDPKPSLRLSAGIKQARINNNIILLSKANNINTLLVYDHL